MSINVSLTQIRYFIAAAEAGKVSKAADRIGISQSAVTTAIQNIETETGIRLMDRSNKGVTVTLEGYRFLNQAKKILTDLNNALQMLSAEHGELEGNLKLGVTSTVAAYFMTERVVAFKAAYPSVDILIEELARETLEEMLLDGSLDIALIPVSNLMNRTGIESETLVRADRHIWMAANHPLAASDSISIEEIADEPFVLVKREGVEETVTEYLNTYGIKPKIALRTSSLETVRNMVSNGLAIAIHSDLVYRPWSLDGLPITRVTPRETLPVLEIGLAVAKEAKMHQCSKAFAMFLREEQKRLFGLA